MPPFEPTALSAGYTRARGDLFVRSGECASIHVSADFCASNKGLRRNVSDNSGLISRADGFSMTRAIRRVHSYASVPEER